MRFFFGISAPSLCDNIVLDCCRVVFFVLQDNNTGVLIPGYEGRRSNNGKGVPLSAGVKLEENDEGEMTEH